MSILDRILGRNVDPIIGTQKPATFRRPSVQTSTDDHAVERYRYLLRTAPPEAIEEAHAEAFAQLTPEQRRLVLENLNSDLPLQERADRDDARSLARMATRAELRRPGTLERTFSGVDPRGGGLVVGNFLNTIAAVVIGTAIADAFLADGHSSDGYQDGTNAAETTRSTEETDSGYDGGETTFDEGAVNSDFGTGDFGVGEF